jgi:hypothetical protein
LPRDIIRQERHQPLHRHRINPDQSSHRSQILKSSNPAITDTERITAFKNPCNPTSELTEILEIHVSD